MYEDIEKVIGGIPQIGRLTIYDVSLRIGQLLSNPVYPKDYLYLNNGAKIGAKKLLGGKRLKWKVEVTTFFSYPEAKKVVGIGSLKDLPNHLIEDFFCVMKDNLAPGPKGVI